MRVSPYEKWKERELSTKLAFCDTLVKRLYVARANRVAGRRPNLGCGGSARVRSVTLLLINILPKQVGSQ